MDSKQKFIRNRYWKRKYRPRNTTTTVNIQKPLDHKKKELSAQIEEDSEKEFILNQPILKEAWFHEYDSSSEIKNFNSLISVSSIVSASSSKNIDYNKECDTNWFDKELDNIQLSSEFNTVKNHENSLILTLQENVENPTSKSNIEINIIDKKNDSKPIDNEEAELEFLLSLKEPVYTGPIILEKNVENERKIASINCIQQKPVKSIDLEKWLDSVLDD